MRKQKRALCLLLSAVMTLSMAMPAAYAAAPNEVRDKMEGTGYSDVTLQVIDTGCHHDKTHWVDNGDGTHSEVCDCGETITSNEPHEDTDGDKACDKCGSDVSCKHGSTHWVDNGNGTHDEVCDCGDIVTNDEAHVDNDGDKSCDKCGSDLSCKHGNTHWVDNKDGTHDEVCSCGDIMTNDEPHVDADGDKACDKCGATICDHEHITYAPNDDGETHDGTCDDCNQPVVKDEPHEDENHDGECDKCHTIVPGGEEFLIATVPLTLPIVMDIQGPITVPTNAVIRNHVTNKSIAVTGIFVEPAEGWRIVGMDEDFAAKSANSNELALSFRQDGTSANSNSIALSAGNWNISGNDSLNLNMAARVPARTEEAESGKIATVGFTLNWADPVDAATADQDKGAGDQDSINKDITEGNQSLSPGMSKMDVLAGGSQAGVFTWSGYPAGTTMTSVTSSDESIASVQLGDSDNNSQQFNVTGGTLGIATVTGTLSNGESETLDVYVSDIVNPSDIVPSVIPENLKAGDTLKTGDIAIEVTITAPDGNKSTQTLYPDCEQVLGGGDNKITVAITIGGREIDVEVVVPVKEAILEEIHYISLPKMGNALRSLTGNICFVNDVYEGNDGIDISQAQDGSVLAVVNGDDATVYGHRACLPPSCSGTFSNYAAHTMDLSCLDTSAALDMVNMFDGCPRLTSLDLSGWNTAKVKRMLCMFQNCPELTSLDLSGFDTSMVTDMRYMFYGCAGLKTLDLAEFDTSSVTNMTNMFSGCSSLKSLDVSGFKTSAAIEMTGMFNGCTDLTNLDLSGFDTRAVKKMNSMFYDCSNLTSLDVSGFDTYAVTDMSYMFKGCSSLKSLDVSNWGTGTVTHMEEMFHSCSGLSSLDLSDWNISDTAARTLGSTFRGTKLSELIVRDEKTKEKMETYAGGSLFGVNIVVSEEAN